MKAVSLAILVLLGVFSSFTTLRALEDQFEISLTVGIDTTAPTAPTGLVATAVSSSQIDLSWSASTDDVAVVAYRVFRDSVFIATSTLLSYSDIGLSLDTLYTYTVSAVDASGNESSQSLSDSATTFSSPPPSGSGGGGGGSGQRRTPIIYDVSVTPSLAGAVITWRTQELARSTLSWGKTGGYEMGVSEGVVFTDSHQVTLEGLSSQTTYLFSIEAESGYGLRAVLSGQEFTTLGLEEGRANATNFVAIPRGESINLSWKNPQEGSFSGVRLVRGLNYFPADPYDGIVISEGRGEAFSDEDVEIGTRYYYALFVQYEDGSFSSGSLATAKILLLGEVPEPFDPFDTLPQAPSVHPKIGSLSFLDFDFIQGGRRIATLGGDGVAIDGTVNLTVSLDYEKVPEVLKTILVSLAHPADPGKTFSFLLRVNEDKTAYSATLAPLGESGRYGVSISIVDYKNRGLKKILGSLFASAELGLSDDEYSWFALFVGKYWFTIVPLLFVAIVTLRALFLLKRRESDHSGL